MPLGLRLIVVPSSWSSPRVLSIWLDERVWKTTPGSRSKARVFDAELALYMVSLFLSKT